MLFAQLLEEGQRVLAVEPAPGALCYLRENLTANGIEDKVIVFAGVVAEVEGKMKIHIIADLEEYSSVGGIVHPNAQCRDATVVEVDANTVDNLVVENGLEPGLIKIDTEGAEYSVLLGAEVTLQRNRPVVLAELSDILLANTDRSVDDIVSFLEGCDYRVVDAADSRQVVRSPFVGDVVALPD